MKEHEKKKNILLFLFINVCLNSYTFIYFHVMPIDDERFFPSLVKVTPHY